MGMNSERLDPVRWRRPGRGTLLRLVAVAALLATAAVVSWSPPRPCAPRREAAAPQVPPGSVGVPVRLADPTALGLIRPGYRVDLLRRADTPGATAVADAALVLDVTESTDPTAGGLLLALTPAEAQRAAAEPGSGFAILIRSG